MGITQEVRNIIENGVAYFSGRDKYFRPIFILESKKLQAVRPIPSAYTVIAVILMLYEFVNKYMSVAGRIENIIMIIDNKDMSVMSVPYKLLKPVIQTLSGRYKCKSRMQF